MEKGRMNSFSMSGQGSRSDNLHTPFATPSHLRPLPGYTPTIISKDNVFQESAPRPANPETSVRYKTRERLYYETNELSTSRKLSTKQPSIMERSAEDAPPAASLYETGTLTPDRKYASSAGEMSIHDPSERQTILDYVSELPMVSEGNWITVFGFPCSHSSAVLDYFKKLGVVEAYELGQGNWLHVKYSTLWAAQKALAKNASVLSAAGSCMIGVIPTQKAMDQVNIASESFMSPIKKEYLRNEDSVEEPNIFQKTGLFSPHPSTIIPGSALRPSTVINNNIVKNTGITRAAEDQSVLSKVFDYVIGW